MGFWKSVGDAALGGLTGGLKGVITSGIGSLFGGLFGSKGPSQEDLMKWQEQMLDKQLNFQADQAGLNRSFQADQASKSRQWNSIQQQLQRARDAGVNPFSLVSSGQYGSAGSSPTPSGSMASGSATIPQPAPNTRLQEAQAFSATAAGLSSIADAKQKGVNTAYFEKGMADMLRKLKGDADGQELANQFQRIINKYQDKISSRTADKLFNEIILLAAQDFKTYQDIQESKARVVALLAKAGVDKQTLKQMEDFYENYAHKSWQADIDLKTAQAGAAGASAIRDVALAGQASQTTKNLEQQHELMGLDLNVRRASNKVEQEAAVRQYVEKAKQYGVITDQMEEALKKAARDNDWYVYDKIVQGISAVAGAYGNIAGGTGSLARYGYIPYGSY